MRELAPRWILPALLLAGAAQARQGADPDREAARLLRERAGVLDAIDSVDRVIDEISRSLARLRLKREELQATLPALETRLSGLDAQVERRRARLKRRLRARESLGRAGPLRLVLGASDLADLIRRRDYVRRIVRHDLRLLEGLRDDRRAAERARSARQAAIAAVGDQEEAAARRRRALESERALKAALLARIRGERSLLLRAKRELASRETEIARRVARSGASGEPERPRHDAAATRAPITAADRAFEAARGGLARPVVGRQIARFGPREDPELGTRTFLKGIEIDAPLGAPVRAVFAGSVVYSGWYKGFGNLIIVRHGQDYYTLYAHLSSIGKARGERVRPGDPIGEVGDTGSLRGPMLYFEIRKGSRALDPAKWLRR